MPCGAEVAEAAVPVCAGAGAAACPAPDSSGEIAATIAPEISSCTLKTSLRVALEHVGPDGESVGRVHETRCHAQTRLVALHGAGQHHVHAERLAQLDRARRLRRAPRSRDPATRTPGIRLSAFVRSDVIPAAKYASLVSRLMLTSGITAIDLPAGAGVVSAGVGRAPACSRRGDS